VGKNRLLIIAVGLIALGITGIFVTTQSRKPYSFGSGGSQMIGMIGGGMMHQEHRMEMMEDMTTSTRNRAGRPA
jgi:hypothetical protein